MNVYLLLEIDCENNEEMCVSPCLKESFKSERSAHAFAKQQAEEWAKRLKDDCGVNVEVVLRSGIWTCIDPNDGYEKKFEVVEVPVIE